MTKAVAVGVAAGAALVLAYRQVLGISRRDGWPPGPDVITAEGAEAAVDAFSGRSPRDASSPFAWSTAATIDPHVEGVEFFPRILQDVERARSSVHILMFGWREGRVGTKLASLLERKLAEGVEVRALVDNFGSHPHGAAREMFTRLASAGAQIVVNDMLPPVRGGLYPERAVVPSRQLEVGRVDHRKLFVIDGKVAWTGGAGIEDHFQSGEFHDVMVRVTGDVVRQAQAAFLTSFLAHGGPRVPSPAACFPRPPEPGVTPVVLAQVIPGGHVGASEAIREQISAARERLDVVNPYLTDHDMLERITAAARRGAAVRIVVSETSNNALASAALRRHYAGLRRAGVELWEVPGTVVHAKVVVADDTVSFGTVNLDAWALYRNSEVMLMARSGEAAELFEERLVEPTIVRANPGEPPAGARARLEGALWDRLSALL